jgi:predicted DCC family thiol-disulfide oxidoreductase YuxK
MKSADSAVQFTVFFDGRCVICSHEIDLYRKRNHAGRLAFVDIMDPEFAPQAWGLDPVLIHERMHGVKRDGTVVEGVDTFIAIWEQLPGTLFSFLPNLARLRVVRPFLNLGYIAFTRVRPYLPRRARSQAELDAIHRGVCTDGWCEMSAVEKARHAQSLREGRAENEV